MVKLKYLITLFVAIIFSVCMFNTAHAATENTQIRIATDHSKLIVGINFNLIIDVHTNMNFKGSDLKHGPLSQFFTVGNISYENLSVSKSSMKLFRWTIPLIPKTAGIGKIPAMDLGHGVKTPKFELNIAPQENYQNSRLVKVDLRAKRLLVGQLAMYRMEIELVPGIKIETITPPTANNADIKRFAERTISRVKNGQFHKTLIHEYKVIFKKAGKNIISSPIIQGYLVAQGNKSFMQRAKDITIDVEDAPKDTYISENLTLATVWTPNLGTDVEVGQPIVRTITIRGTNNSIEQLPNIELPIMDDFDTYDNSNDDTEKLMRNKQLISTRTIKHVFVPKRNHIKLDIPSVKLKWLNPNDGMIRDLDIEGASYNIDGFSFNDYIPRNPKYTKPIIFGTIAFVLLSVFLYFSVIWYRARKGIYANIHNYVDKQIYWQKFARKWSNSKPMQARQALLNWAKARWPHLHIVGLNTIPFYKDAKELIDEMNNACWDDSVKWNGKNY